MKTKLIALLFILAAAPVIAQPLAVKIIGQVRNINPYSVEYEIWQLTDLAATPDTSFITPLWHVDDVDSVGSRIIPQGTTTFTSSSSFILNMIHHEPSTKTYKAKLIMRFLKRDAHGKPIVFSDWTDPYPVEFRYVLYKPRDHEWTIEIPDFE